MELSCHSVRLDVPPKDTPNQVGEYWPSCAAFVNDGREVVFLKELRSYPSDQAELILWNVTFGFQVERAAITIKQPLHFMRPISYVYDEKYNRFLIVSWMDANPVFLRINSIALNKNENGVVCLGNPTVVGHNLNLPGLEKENYAAEYMLKMFFVLRTDGPATIFLNQNRQIIEIDPDHIGDKTKEELPYELNDTFEWPARNLITFYNPHTDCLYSLTNVHQCYNFKTGVRTRLEYSGQPLDLQSVMSMRPPGYTNIKVKFYGETMMLICVFNGVIDWWKGDMVNGERHWERLMRKEIGGMVDSTNIWLLEDCCYTTLVTGRHHFDKGERSLTTHVASLRPEKTKQLRELCFETLVMGCKCRATLAKHPMCRALPMRYKLVEH